MQSSGRHGQDGFEAWGAESDPLVLILRPDAGPDWQVAAPMLAEAGRRVVLTDARHVPHLASWLDGMGSRPVLICDIALADQAYDLARASGGALFCGLVLVTRGEGAAVPADSPVPVLLLDADTTGADEESLVAALVDFLERQAPRKPILYQAGSDARTLRDALGCFATGVTIVTTRDSAGAPVGLTANSFTSVSLDPPLILFCLSKTSSNLEPFDAGRHFAVNVLHIGQQPASNVFARPHPDRFGAVPWEEWDTGAPILSGSLASFECEQHQCVDAGDHLVVIGRVTRARFEPHRDPLLYFRGKYRRLHFT